MRVAVLFDSDHPMFGGMYGWDIRDYILNTGVLQACERLLKVKVGDVLLYGKASTKTEYIELAELLYFDHPWQLLDESRLRSTYMKSTVCAWVIENIDKKTARKLHHALSNYPAYLGMHGVNLRNPAHLLLYRNSMIGKYRIKGKSCNIFYSMGSEEEMGSAEPDELKKLGFDFVEWEDKGAHGTIFDDYNTKEHFERVESFRDLMASSLQGGEDDADELVMLLEDLSPRLFGTLGACARALEEASHEEDIAQAGLSVRRFIEQLADVLFPPRNVQFNGRDVTKDKFKNRIWAYIDSSFPEGQKNRAQLLNNIGKEVDRLINEVNAILHGKPDKERLEKALIDMAVLSATLLQLNPEVSRNPYYAFKDNILKFFEDAVGKK